MSALKLSMIDGMASSTANRVLKLALVTVLACSVLSSAGGPAAAQQRVLGIDVSAWQGYMSQTTWNNIHNVNNRDFVFVRSSRGGTTGEDHRQGGYPSGDNTFHNLSQRYDDPRFVWNITKATAAGMLAGPYHYARPDIIETTPNSGGIANTGGDEADHFIEMAGAWMRPGYLLPAFDLEAGESERTDNELAQFCIDFSDRIYEVMGIRPAIYTNGNYAYYVLQQASPALQDAVVAAFPTLWSARWPNQSDPDSIPIQTGHPKDSWTQIYGPWDDPPNPTHPWSFWQYTSMGYLSSYSNRLDFNVAQGGMEFLKDHLVPALWTTDSDGQWTTLSNWNSGQTPVAPVEAEGQLDRYGPLTLPAVRLPGGDDTVILDRPAADITVTLASGAHNIRKLEVREALNITGGSLTIHYVPAADSTPIAAQLSAPVALDGGSLSVHTLQVDATQVFSLGGGTLTFDTLHLMPHSSAPARIGVIGDVSFNPLADAAAAIQNGAGAGSSGLIDLGGANRTWQVSNGGAAVDLSVNVPIVNGALTKDGTGTLALTAANTYTAGTTIEAGTLLASNTTGSATGSGAVQVNNSGTLGGIGRITGPVAVASGGTVAPGTSPGLLTVGDVTFHSGSTFAVELAGDGGAAGTDFDQLVVNNSTALGGALLIDLISSFTPDGLDSFTVLSSASLTGAFANVANGARLDTLGSEGSFIVSYDGTTNAVELSDFLPFLLGDVYLDGEVNELDVDPFLECLLTGPYDVRADMNQDGHVNGVDVDLFASAVVVGGNVSAAPEPSSFVLVIVGLLALIGWAPGGMGRPRPV